MTIITTRGRIEAKNNTLSAMLTTMGNLVLKLDII